MEKPKADKKWMWLNEDLQKYMKAKDYWNLGGTYYEMADVLKSEGKDDSKMRELGYGMKKKVADLFFCDFRKFGAVKKIEIITTDDSCEACKLVASQNYDFANVLVSRPLPVKECAHPYGCRCIYAVGDFDNNKNKKTETKTKEIRETKCTCSACGNTWFYGKEEQRNNTLNQIHNASKAMMCCGGCLPSLMIKNKEVKDLSKCPKCNSKAVAKEIVVHNV